MDPRRSRPANASCSSRTRRRYFDSLSNGLPATTYSKPMRWVQANTRRRSSPLPPQSEFGGDAGPAVECPTPGIPVVRPSAARHEPSSGDLIAASRNSASRNSPSGQGPCPLSASMRPASPASTNVEPQASASSREYSADAHGSVRLATSRLGQGNGARGVAGQGSATIVSNAASEGGATRKAPRTSRLPSREAACETASAPTEWAMNTIGRPAFDADRATTSTQAS